MTTLERSWEQEVRDSRIVILPQQESYLQEVAIRVGVILDQLAQGFTETQLRQVYPTLTAADIRACELFAYLRAVQKI